MIKNVVVVGAGVGGLGAAIGLARSGRRVTVIDKDPPPPTEDAEATFASWDRAGVPQARQPHAFWARSRNLLGRYAPDVLDRLGAIGVGRWNIMDMAPPESREPSDEQFTSLLVRRLPFELTLRQVAASEPLIELRPHTVVDGLALDESAHGPAPLVAGVRLRGGETLGADLVIDAAGRRSRASQSLAEQGVTLPTEVEDCNMMYYGRYYRQHEGSDLDRNQLVRGAADLGYLSFGTFLGDNRTLAFFLGSPPWDTELKALRHNRAWEAAARSIPVIAPWIDPGHSAPVTDVQAMAGHQNVLRRFVADGKPLVRGLLPVGDALCTTNPAFGWGASLALTYAFAAVDAIVEHGDNLEKLALAYEDAVMGDAEAYFRASAAQDRFRTYRWRGEGIPEEARDEAERQELLENGLLPAMRRDTHVLRMMLRRMNLVDPPDAIWSDEQAVATAREVAAWRAANRPPTVLGPPRGELLEIMSGSEAR